MKVVAYIAGVFAGILVCGWWMVRPPLVCPWWVLVIVGGCGVFLTIFGRWCWYYGHKSGMKKAGGEGHDAGEAPHD